MRNRIKKWWQAPRKYTELQADRKVSALELFSDLVYVAYLSRIAHPLIDELSIPSIGTFVFMFLLGWWAWYNGTTYHDAHGNDDLRTRMFTFFQMFFVMYMAVNSHDGLTKNVAHYIGGFIGFQLIVTYLWWCTGSADNEYKSISRIHVASYLMSVFLFSLSIFSSHKLVIWMLAILCITIVPSLIINVLVKKGKIPSSFFESFQITHAILERFSLFTIIVIGEIILSFVSSLGHMHHLGRYEIFMIGLSVLICSSIWSLYFDLIADRKPAKDMRSSALWMALHLPLQMSISVIGIALIRLINEGVDFTSFNSSLLLYIPIVNVLIIVNLLYRLRKVESSMTKWFFCSIAIILSVIFAEISIVFKSLLILVAMWIPLLMSGEDNIFSSKM